MGQVEISALLVLTLFLLGLLAAVVELALLAPSGREGEGLVGGAGSGGNVGADAEPRRAAGPVALWHLRADEDVVITTMRLVQDAVLFVAVILIAHSLAPEFAHGGTAVVYAAAVSSACGMVFLGILPASLVQRGSRWLPRVAPLVAWLVALLRPVVVMARGLGDLAHRVLSPRAVDVDQAPVMQEEFRTLVEAGVVSGEVNASEKKLINRVLDFSDKNVGQVMTPRERIFAVAYDLPMSRIVRDISQRGFSRVPIFQKNLDNIKGVLNAKDLVRLGAGLTGEKSLAQLLTDPLFVPRTTSVRRLFVMFQQKKIHMAMVVNEYGKILGLVTMDDVLEQLFGAIRDEREQLQDRPSKRATRTPVQGVPILVPTPAEGDATSSTAEAASTASPGASDEARP